MNERFIVSIIIFGLVIIGFIIKFLEILKFSQRIDYTVEYRNRFIELMNDLEKSNKLNMKLYQALVSESNQMQDELGLDGILASYSDPLKGIAISNYPFLINFLPEIRQDMNNYLGVERIEYCSVTCDNMMLRHLGSLDHVIKLRKKDLFNPFSCFANGIRFIVSLPINILYWCGLISLDSSIKIERSFISKLINNILVIVSLLGSLATLILGWNELISIFNQLILMLSK